MSTFADVGVVDVGDFEFAAPGRHERLDLVEHSGVVHVEAGDGEIRFGLARLLLDADDPVAGDFGHAEALRVGNFLEQDVGAFGLPAETVGRRAECSPR